MSTVILPIWQPAENKDFDSASRCRLVSVAAADNVLKRLKTAKVKPKDLTKALGIGSSMASRILDGHRGISTWHLDALAAMLNVSVPDLFAPDETDVGVGPTPEKKSYALTSSDTPSEVLDQANTFAGGHSHGDASIGGGRTSDRLSEPQSAHDAEVQRLHDIESIHKLIGDLERSADVVRSVARDLKAHVPTDLPRKHAPARDRRRANIRAPKARRGTRR
jgi:hypothetical protein